MGSRADTWYNHAAAVCSTGKVNILGFQHGSRRIRGVLILRTGIRSLVRRPLQSILCILGVALGVAVVVAIDLANSSASRAFILSTETVAGRATHQIIGASGSIDQDVYRRLKVELGLEEAAPIVDGYATAIELDRQPLRILGVDVFAEAPFRGYLGGGASRLDLNGFTQFLTRPDSILIGTATASRYGLSAGDHITLRVGDRRQAMRIVGILQPADENSARALDGLGIVDVSAAQELFGLNNRLSHIDLIADGRTSEGRELLARIKAILPEDVRITKPQTRSQSIESLTDAFELNLTALSLLALVVGMFLIYNTITFSVVQRRPLFGTLRCLGVTKEQIFQLVLFETIVLSTIGAILGLGFGLLLGRGAVSLVTQTINDLYYVVNVRSINIAPLTLVKGVGLGIGAAVLAALAPAFEATSIPPISVMKRSNIEQRVRRLLPLVALVGLGLFVIGVLMLLLSSQLVVNLGGIFGVVIGLALVSPLVTVWLMRLCTPLAGRLAGVIGRLATRAVANAISRTSIAIASLMIAVSVIIGLQSMIRSFRVTVETWLGATLIADVYVSPPSSGVNNANSVIDPQLLSDFKAQPGVAAVTSLRRIATDFVVVDNAPSSSTSPDWQTAGLLVVHAETDRQASSFVWTNGDHTAVWNRMLDLDEVQVSEPFANKHGITQQHNVLLLQTGRGQRQFRVVGVYYDYSADQGVILMRREIYDRYWNDPRISSLAIYLTPEFQQHASGFVSDMRQRFAGRDLVITANRELRTQALNVFDRTFAITGALNLLATVVAFIGVLSALMALQIERTRELGVLRANGMTIGQLWQLTLIETGLMGATAGVLSMPTGYLLALILVYIINLRSFGWTIRLELEWTTFAQALLVAVASALLAALYPMLRMGKIQIANALRQE
jgi:putative ABC transport system permease protein